jgi:hypothetical protein
MYGIDHQGAMYEFHRPCMYGIDHKELCMSFTDRACMGYGVFGAGAEEQSLYLPVCVVGREPFED